MYDSGPYAVSWLIRLSLAGVLLAGGPSWAQGDMNPTPQVRQTVPPLGAPDKDLEQALRTALFPVRVPDAQGHGPDPGSEEWKSAEANQIARACKAAGPVRYAYNTVDLNQDGRDEVVATVTGPYTCGTGGCAFYVFQSTDNGLRLVTGMTLFKPPLIVSDRLHNGWNELIARVRIDAGHSEYALLRFDGKTYPTNPSVPPAERLRASPTGVAMLDFYSEGSIQHPLPCER